MNLNLRKLTLHSLDDRRANMFEIGTLNLGEFENNVPNRTNSVACMVWAKDFKLGTYELNDNIPMLKEWIWMKYQTAFGERENYRDELALGFGTAFLVGEQTVLTAGHCITVDESSSILKSSEELKTIRFVFDFQMTKQNMDRAEFNFNENNVYKFKKVIAFKNIDIGNDREDWALIKLDRKVIGRQPLKLNFNKIVQGEKLYMLGHPMGLPMKLTWGAEVKKEGSDQYLEADLDTFTGSSGSPVSLEETEEVSAILVATQTLYEDFAITEHYYGTGKKRVYTVHLNRRFTRVQIDVIGYSVCQRISALHFVKHYLQVKKDKVNGVKSDVAVQNALGEYYFNSTGGVVNNQKIYKKAFKHFKMCQMNSPWRQDVIYNEHSLKAFYNLARCYDTGKGIAKSKSSALIWYEFAALYGHLEAAHRTGLRYLKGIGAGINLGRAVRFFEKTTALGDTRHLNYLATYFRQREMAQKAFEYSKKAADAGLGDVEILKYVGICYLLGRGIEENSQKATEYLSRAVEGGNISCHLFLGMAHKSELEYEKAFENFQKAEITAHPTMNPYIFTELGQCYWKGWGVSQDKEKAREYFMKAGNDKLLDEMNQENIVPPTRVVLSNDKKFDCCAKMIRIIKDLFDIT